MTDSAALDGVFRTETDPAVSWLGLPLLRLLARGEPVRLDDLAAATGRPPELIRRTLAGHTDIEYDDEGRIVGNGLTLRPTHHRFEVDGRQLYTWCALDALVYPSMLRRPARIESPCHATGVPIRLVVGPDRVAQVEPDTAVVSLVAAADRSSIRSSFCDQVHFFVLRPGAFLRQRRGRHRLARPAPRRVDRPGRARPTAGPADDLEPARRRRHHQLLLTDVAGLVPESGLTEAWSARCGRGS